MRERAAWPLICVGLGLLLVIGCGGDDSVAPGGSNGTTGSTSNGTGATTSSNGTSTSNGTTGTTGGSTGDEGGGVGEPCATDEGCRDRLVCDLGRCAPPEGQGLGEPCQYTTECDLGLYCDDNSLCQPSGELEIGALCTETGECRAGLVCSDSTLYGRCLQAGEGDIDEPCGESLDCFAGLVCVENEAGASVCTAYGDAQTSPPFTGKDCAFEDGEDPPLRAYFEIDDDPKEFYRLPFPNDIRIGSDGRPSMAGHTAPGENISGVDLVARTLEAVESFQDGFGLSQGTYFRFSGAVNFNSLSARGDEASVLLVDITPDSPEYSQRQPILWEASTGRGKYICHHWVNIRPAWGRPLSPNTTYAAILTADIVGPDGSVLIRESDFVAMVGEERPSEERLAAAWDIYSPLRAWLTEEGRPESSILAATVFTTGDPTAISGRLREAVHATDVAEATDLTLCDNGVVSPCDDGLGGDAHVRGCFEAAPDYDEIHGKLSLPIFQKGAPPYLSGGGGIAVDELGMPQVQRSDDVCMAMTVPTDGEMPQAGWPVLIVPHALGDSFRGHVDPFASTVSALPWGDSFFRMVTLSWDQVLHGARSGLTDLDPTQLLYDYNRPEAAVGNILQSASELQAVVRWLGEADINADASPTGARVRFDINQIYVLGHDLGGTTAMIGAAYEPNIRTLLLSSTGGGLAHTLLGKTSPVNLPKLFKIAIEDSNPNESHPVVNMMQGYYDQIDPANYAERLTTRALPGVGPKHLLFMMGIGDTYATRLGMETVATGLRLEMASPLLQTFQYNPIDQVELPVSGNLLIGEQEYTIVGRQYEPDFYDGSLVLFRNPQVQTNIALYLVNGLRFGIPRLRD